MKHVLLHFCPKNTKRKNYTLNSVVHDPPTNKKKYYKSVISNLTILTNFYFQTLIKPKNKTKEFSEFSVVLIFEFWFDSPLV